MTRSTAIVRAVRPLRGVVRSLSGQLALLACATVAPVLAGLLVLAVLMLVSDEEVALVTGILAGAAVLALAGAIVFSRAIAADLDAIRAGLEAVGDGDREVRIETSANDELARVARAANAMVARLDDEEAARRHLLAAVSHDLRTPLTSLRLLADAIGDELVDGEQRRVYSDRIAGHVAALGALIDDLFELARLEAGDVAWTVGRVALDDLVADTLEVMRAQGERKGVIVTSGVPGGLAVANANPEKLQRVLFNLVDNAIRHTPPGGSVAVCAQSVAAGVEVEVADTGEGIDPRDRERVFERFERADGPQRDGARAGIGLAVARAIVEAHGGRIWIAEAPRGTCVRFALPVGDGRPAGRPRGVSSFVTPGS